MWCTKKNQIKDLAPLQIGLGRRRRLVAVRQCAQRMAVRRDGKSEQLIKNKCNVLGSLNSFRLHVCFSFGQIHSFLQYENKDSQLELQMAKQEKYRFSILTCSSLKNWRNLICNMKSPDLKSTLTFVCQITIQLYIITLLYLLCSTNHRVPAF